MESNFVNKNRRFFVRKQRPTPQPCKKVTLPSRVYQLTFSSNHAKRKNAFKAYKYVIRQLPTGDFFYTHEVSKYGKYHIHGTMYFKYKFDYIGLTKSKCTQDGFEFDVHIDYKRIDDPTHIEDWLAYSEKNSSNRKYFQCDPGACLPLVKIPESCIPQIKKIVMEKPMAIPGICHK